MNAPLPALLLAMCCSCSLGHAQDLAAAPARSGTVKTAQGEVSVRNPQGQHRVQPGDPIAPADQLITGADGAASLVLRDGTTLVLGPNSQLELQSYAFDGTSHKGNMLLSLLRGTLRLVTGLLGKNGPDAVHITTPTSIIGVLGTDFIVQATGTTP